MRKIYKKIKVFMDEWGQAIEVYLSAIVVIFIIVMGIISIIKKILQL